MELLSYRIGHLIVCWSSENRVSRRKKSLKNVVISTDKSENGLSMIRRSTGRRVRVEVDDYFLEFVVCF